MCAALAQQWLSAEVAALEQRLAAVPNFSATIPMVPDATPSAPALELADRVVGASRERLAHTLRRFHCSLGSPARSEREFAARHLRYVALRNRFHALLSTVDVFADALTQRSEHGTGVLLKGLDALAEDGLRTGAALYRLPPVVCYLDHGFGGAIRRAFTRLPGGEKNVLALVRLPRERLCGGGLASLLHEVGHQGVALLKLTPAYVRALQTAVARGEFPETAAHYWSRKMNEVLADVWACAKLGAAGTIGLMGVLGTGVRTTFGENPAGPHPMPYLRGELSAAFGAAAAPHPSWLHIVSTWRTLYPLHRAPRSTRELLEVVLGSVPSFARLLATHRPAELRWSTLPEVLGMGAVAPSSLTPRLPSMLATLRTRPETVRPCHGLAAVVLARHRGLIAAKQEHRAVENLLRRWATTTSTSHAPPNHKTRQQCIYRAYSPRKLTTWHRQPMNNSRNSLDPTNPTRNY